MKKLFIILAFSIGLMQFLQSAEFPSASTFEKKRFTILAALRNFFSRSPSESTQPAYPAPVIPAIKTIPIAHYDGNTKELIVALVPENYEHMNPIKSYPHFVWHEVIFYQFSPEKKYLLINTGTSSTFGSTETTKIVDTSSLKEIATFRGSYITHQFSPYEQSFILATAQRTLLERLGITKPSRKGAAETGERKQSKTGEILRYELFDIPSQSILKTFENIQTIIYELENTLIVQYDDMSKQKISIQRNVSLFLSQRLLNIFIKQPTSLAKEEATIDSPPYTLAYYLKTQKLTVTRRQQQPEYFYTVLSYSLSPSKKYLLINSIPPKGESVAAPITEPIKGIAQVVKGKSFNSTTIILDVTTGKKIETSADLNNLVNYEFNNNEQYLLFLAPAEKPEYKTLTIATGKISAPFKDREGKDVQTAYFTKENKLVMINNDGEKTEIDVIKKIEEKPFLEYAREAVQRGSEASLKAITESAESITESITTKIGSDRVEKVKNILEQTSKLFMGLYTIEKEEVVISPAIQQGQLNDVILIAGQLDNAIAALPVEEQANWRTRGLKLFEDSKEHLQRLIAANISAELRQHGTEMLRFIIPFVWAVGISATANLAYQMAKLGTGNISEISSEKLLISGLSAVTTSLLKLLLGNHYPEQQVSLLTPVASTVLSQAIINPSLQSGAFTITLPPLRESLKNWMASEALIITMKAMQANMDDILQKIRNIDLSDMLTIKAPLLPPNNEIITLITPFVQNVVSNEEIASVLAEISWMVLQSGIIGGVLYLTHLGYAEMSMMESMSYAIITGMAQGTIAKLAELTPIPELAQRVITISTPSYLIASLPDVSPQAVISTALQASVTEITNSFR